MNDRASTFVAVKTSLQQLRESLFEINYPQEIARQISSTSKPGPPSEILLSIDSVINDLRAVSDRCFEVNTEEIERLEESLEQFSRDLKRIASENAIVNATNAERDDLISSLNRNILFHGERIGNVAVQLGGRPNRSISGTVAIGPSITPPVSG